MGIGIGGEMDVAAAAEFWSFEGGVEGREEKRLKPGSDATIAMDPPNWTNPGIQILFFLFRVGMKNGK